MIGDLLASAADERCSLNPFHAIVRFLHWSSSIFEYRNKHCPQWVTASQLVITCSKLRIEILEQGVKYVQS